jgi:hypothetical protein
MRTKYYVFARTAIDEQQLDFFESYIWSACGRSSSICKLTAIASSEIIYCPDCNCVAPFPTVTSGSCHAA